jgi:hypothetical protein
MEEALVETSACILCPFDNSRIGHSTAGGIVAEYLGRLGVGRLVLVDYDRLKIGKLQSVTSGIRQLLVCDLLIASADEAFAGQVLDHAAYAHVIPVIDGGTILLQQSGLMSMTVGKSQVVSAGRRCSSLVRKADTKGMKLNFAITEAEHETAMHLLFGPEWLRPQDQNEDSWPNSIQQQAKADEH